MELNVGDEISCDELKEKEKYIWKILYQDTWPEEKKRLDKVIQLIKSLNDNLDVNIVGFGADTTEFISKHPKIKGEPDLAIVHKQNKEQVLIRVEVSGTNFMKGTDYWIREDKIDYVQNHYDEDVWFILYYQNPIECFIFIKTIAEKRYEVYEENIHGATEYYCKFRHGDPEIHTQKQFGEYLDNLIKKNE